MTTDDYSTVGDGADLAPMDVSGRARLAREAMAENEIPGMTCSS